MVTHLKFILDARYEKTNFKKNGVTLQVLMTSPFLRGEIQEEFQG
jgi:hypothetical protein